MSGPLFNEARTDEPALRPIEKPGPAWYEINWDGTKASAADVAADVPGRGYERRQGEIAHAAAEFARQTGKRPDAYYLPMWGEPVGNVPLVDEERLFRDIRRYREAGNPDAFKDLGVDIADFDKRLRGRFRKEDADREKRMAKNGFVGNLVGGVAGAFTDPINILTLPLGGGGKTVAGQIIRAGMLNAAIEAGETPAFIAERAYQGRDWSASEMGQNILYAGLGGAAFDAAGKAIPASMRGVASLDSKLYDAAAPVQAKIDPHFAEADMVRAFRQMTPDHLMTPDQAAAVHVLTRDAEVRASNPFQNTYDAIDAHISRVAEFERALAAGPQAAAPVAPGGAAATGPALVPDFENAWNAIIGIEGGTNRDGSFRTSPAGAVGPAQVMPGTAPEAARLAGLPWDEARYRSDPDYNIALGRAYYREMLRQFDGDPVKAAAAYNAGPGSAARGTGVRGAMAKARRAGIPHDWVSFLPAKETRDYVANFQRRTGMAPGLSLDDGDLGMPMRDPALDAERPQVTLPKADDLLDGALPELRRELFPDENGWRIAQAEHEARELGLSQPAVTRQSVWREARAALEEAKSGEVKGALYHPDVGPIDVMYGDEKSGLAHILAKHPEVADDLPELLAEMELVPGIDGRAHLESLDHTASVRLDWDGKEKRWLLTAFQREEPKLRAEGKTAPSPADDRRASDLAGASPSAGAMRDIALERHDIKFSPGIGDFAHFWDGSMARGEQPRRVFALVDSEGNIRGWETTHPRAERQLGRRGMDDGRVVEIAPPRADAEGVLFAPLDEATARGFDDPHGEQMRKIADGVWHDIMASEDPGIRVDLGDGKGERSIAEIREELDKDGGDIDAIEACMRPGMNGGDA